jgi:hypothetical protein
VSAQLEETFLCALFSALTSSEDEDMQSTPGKKKLNQLSADELMKQ